MRSIDDVLAEERIRGKPNRWCGRCCSWHFDECKPSTAAHWSDRLEVELLVLAGRVAQ